MTTTTRRLTSLAFTLLASLAMGGCSSQGTVQVQIRSRDKITQPAPGAEVYVSDLDGQLLESGRADSDGNYETAEYDRPIHLTVRNEQELQTVMDAAPGKHYVFLTYVAGKTLGHIEVEAVPPPGLPAPSSYRVRSGGPCQIGLSPSTTLKRRIQVTDACLQDDGRLTTLIEAYDNQGRVVANAVSYDLEPPKAGQVQTLRFDQWSTPAPNRTRIAVKGLPAPLATGSMHFQVLRKGQVFNVGAAAKISDSAPNSPSAAFDVPANLSHPTKDVATIVQLFMRSSLTPDIATEIFQTFPAMPGQDFQFDIGNIVPAGRADAVIDRSSPGTLGLTWQISSRASFELLSSSLSWNDNGNYWVWTVRAPADRGELALPMLPDVFSPPAPTASVLFDAYVSAVDLSWTDDYDVAVNDVNEGVNEGPFVDLAPGRVVRSFLMNVTEIQ